MVIKTISQCGSGRQAVIAFGYVDLVHSKDWKTTKINVIHLNFDELKAREEDAIIILHPIDKKTKMVFSSQNKILKSQEVKFVVTFENW